MTTACQETCTQDGQMHFYSVAFTPFKPLIPSPAAALGNPACWIQHPALAAGTREALAQVPLAEPQPQLLPAEEGREGPSFLQSPVCTITSPLRNSALVIEKGKICTTYSSLQETGGVIQDAEILSLFFFFVINSEICALDAVIPRLPLLWSWPSHLCSASQYLSICSTKGCAYFPPPSGHGCISQETTELRIWPSQPRVSNPALPQQPRTNMGI